MEASTRDLQHDGGLVGWIIGLVVVLSYPCIWVSSLATLFGGPVFLLLGWWYALGALLVIAVVGRAPDGMLAVPGKLIRNVYVKFCPCYFTSCKLRVEQGASLGAEGTPPTVLAVHPHGIFSMGWGLAYILPDFEGLRFCFSPTLLLSPFWRLFSRLVGRPGSAAGPEFKKLLREGKSWAIIPGGFEEATIHSSSTPRVYLKDRVGFVKYALQYGYSLTPMYVFGEHRTFGNVQGGWSWRLWLNGFGIPAILPWGVWWCPFLMRSTDLLLCVGTPLQLPKLENPSREEVQRHHAAYLEHFKRFWERNNPNKEDKLQIW